MFNLGENRDTFTDLIKPAGDCRIEYIFGTCLVLDIRWLFNLLLSLSENNDHKEKWSDPGRLLSAFRSYREKMDLFVQFGKIERTSYDLLLEEVSQIKVKKQDILMQSIICKK